MPPLIPSPSIVEEWSVPARRVPRVRSGFYAAIDLGSTSCRLLVARYTRHGLRIVERCSSPVLLAKGIQQTGYLTEEAMNRTLKTLKSYARRLRRWPIIGIQGITTEVCRQALNAHDFLARVYRETGLTITIISSREEAELAVEGCASLLSIPSAHTSSHSSVPELGYSPPALPERALIFDIGGGSTELSWVHIDHTRQTRRLAGVTSLKLGIISLAERFSHLPRHEAYDAIFSYTHQQLCDFERIHCIKREIIHNNVRMIGTSGTITALASMAMGLERYDWRQVDGAHLNREQLTEALERLKEMPSHDIDKHPCIGRRQSALLMSGCAIFDAIQSVWPVEHIVIADRGLRDGLITRMTRKRHKKHSS